MLHKVAGTFFDGGQFVGVHPEVSHDGVVDPVFDLRLLARLEADLAAGAALGLRTHDVPRRYSRQK